MSPIVQTPSIPSSVGQIKVSPDGKGKARRFELDRPQSHDQSVNVAVIFLFRGKSIHPFCDKVKQDPLETECTDDRNSVALCNLVEQTDPLPNVYQVSRKIFISWRN